MNSSSIWTRYGSAVLRLKSPRLPDSILIFWYCVRRANQHKVANACQAHLMKTALLLFTFFTGMLMPTFAGDASDLAAAFSDAAQDAAKYALTEMRPTADFQSASIVTEGGIPKIRETSVDDGGQIKVRVSASWITAFLRTNRYMVVDVWLTVEGNGVYLTRYKLYSDDHNIPITNSQDMRCKKYLGSVGTGSSKKDDF
jgi:hypothetical protein